MYIVFLFLLRYQTQPYPSQERRIQDGWNAKVPVSETSFVNTMFENAVIVSITNESDSLGCLEYSNYLE